MQFNLINTTHKSGVAKATGKPYSIHEAQGLIETIDKDGNVGSTVCVMRMPDSAPLGLPRGLYEVDVQPYADREMKVAFAIRKLEPAKTQPQAKAA